MVELLCWSLFPGAMALAGSMDLVTMTIPNRISIFLVVAFLVLAPLVGLTPAQFATHVATGLLMLSLGIFMFARGWVGGGDAKMFAAASLWFGFEFLGDFAAASAVAGGLLTIALLIFRMMPLPAACIRQEWIARLHKRGGGVPYGIAMAAAALVVYPSTPWLQAVLA